MDSQLPFILTPSLPYLLKSGVERTSRVQQNSQVIRLAGAR